MKTGSWRAIVAAVLACALSAGCGKRSVDESFAAAKQRLAQNDLPGAIIELKNTLAAQPDLAEARFLLGKALLDREDAVSAAVELRKAKDLNAPADEVVPLLATALLNSGESQRVIDLDGTTVLEAPEAIASLKTSAALAHSALGHRARAEKALALALEAKGDHVPALLFRARLLGAKGEFDAAAELIDTVIAAAPRDPDALTLKGELLLARGDTAGATAMFRQALDVKPGHLAAHSALLTHLLDQNDLEGARAQLVRLRTVRPTHFQTKYFDVRLKAQGGDLKAADEGMKRLLAIAPANPRVLQLAAAVALRLGQLPQAEAHLAKLIQQAPELAIARRMLARVFLGSGRPANALEALEPLLSSETADAETLMLAGAASLVSGDAKRAEILFGRATKLNPADASSRTARAVSRFEKGDVATGLRELEDIAGAEKGTGAVMALIAVQVNQRQFDAALRAIAQLEKKQPGKPLAPHLRARVLTMKGDFAAARASYEKALAADPEFFASVDGLAALDLRDGRPEQARARYAAMLERKRDDVRAIAALAALDDRTGKPKRDVTAQLERAVAIQPNDPSLRRRLVRFHLSKQDYKLALVAAQDAVAARPNDTDMLELLAAAQLAANEPDQAMRSYTKLVALQPKSVDMLVGLAEAQFAASSYKQANETARRALSLAPDSVTALQTAVKIDLQAERYDLAVAKAKATQKRRPSESYGWLVEGDVEFARKNWPAAAAAFRTALQKQDASPIAQRLHAALRASGDKAQTDAFAGTWLKSHPKDVAFLGYLASWAIADKELERASARLDEALRITPDNAALLNNSAWVLATLKRPGAVAVAERANKLSPDQPLYLDTLAYALAADGNLARAVEVQKLALSLSPSAHALRLNLAQLHMQAGDKTAAREELGALARLGDQFPRQKEVRELQAKL